MDKRNILFLMSAICAIFLFSCSSTPKEEPEPETPVPVEQTVEESKPTESTVASQNKALLNQILAARDMAVVAGANNRFANEFNAADEKLAQLRSALESNPEDSTLADQLKDALALYQAFEKLTKALTAKERIDNFGFVDYDKASYDLGEQTVQEIYDIYGKSEKVAGDLLLEKADKALVSYTAVLNAAFKELSQQEKAAALEFKAKSDEIKADKAAKNEYSSAVLKFTTADTNFVAADYEAAYNGFSEAHISFKTIFNDVSAKRQAALDAMEKAKQKELEVTKYGEQADSISPLPNQEDNQTAPSTEAAQ